MSLAPPMGPSQATRHLLLPFAASMAPAWLQVMKALPADHLRHAQKLLRGMQPRLMDLADAHSLSPPHERALARAHELSDAGLRDGLIPWAAWQRAQSSPEQAPQADRGAWAWVTPCHWAMGREQATLTDPQALGLSEAESRALLLSMQAYFAADGITLHYAQPHRWLAEGELFRDQPTASLDRALGRSVDPWLPAAQASAAPTTHDRGSAPPQAHAVKSVGASQLRRLQNEMQMLLYTHVVNEVREQKKQQPVNSIWFSGTGQLTALRSKGAAAEAQPNLSAPRTLAQAALSEDWQTYAAAWAALDASEIQALLARQQAGETVQLTLCGERAAQTFETARTGFFARVSGLFAAQPLLDVLEQL